MSVTVSFVSKIQVDEVLTVTAPADSGSGSITLHHTGYDLAKSSLVSTSTQPVTQAAYFSKALSSGAATIDLTSLTGAAGTIDGTGLKVQFARFYNPATNANAITVTFGASNPYLLGGSAFKWILQPGQSITIDGNEATPDIASGAKTIDLAGTGAQALQCTIILG